MNKTFYRPDILISNLFSGRSYSVATPLSSTKNLHVETLRGFAIILVVFGHIIGSTNTGGMKVADDSIFRYLYFSLEYIRMPLFTVISGWVYANKPVKILQQGNFVKGKLRRLLLPMFVISTLLFLFRMVIPGTNSKPELSSLAYNIVFPYDIYWYLYSLFLIFLVITVLDTQKFFHQLHGWFVVLVIAFALLFVSKTFLVNMPNLFSVKGAMYLFPFFITGIGIYRFHHILFTRSMLLLLLFVFCGGIILQQMTWFGYLPTQGKQSVLGITVGMTAALLLFQVHLRSNLLIWIGSYAYGIFLFHVFFTGGTRIVLLRAGMDHKWVILLSALVISILIPILIEILIKRSAILRFCLLGLKKNER